ncbi:hypothetical protein LCGC14_2728600 [marine sediment metagenome]|uniref:Uncharacterized protein n=1 Tax=marine sediment metagenome TaxID=412755 RepID=A0A0F9BZQ6_9ZZZZ
MKLEEKLNEIFDSCYSKDLSICPKHKIFQRQKAQNLILELESLIRKDERERTLRELRDKWCYEQAHGRAVFSLRLYDWARFLIDAGLGDEDWWEIREYWADEERRKTIQALKATEGKEG